MAVLGAGAFGAVQYLKSGITFEMLDAVASRVNDHQAAQRMQRASDRLFQSFTRLQKLA